MTQQTTMTTWWRTAQRSCVLAALAGVAMFLPTPPALADFRVCNNTSSRVGVAIGYKD